MIKKYPCKEAYKHIYIDIIRFTCRFILIKTCAHKDTASCATNGYLLDFYWKLGRDIEAKQYANTYGSGFYKNLSQDLKNEMSGVKGFSPINLRYMSKFFKLYAPLYRNIPQTAELFSDSLSDSNVPQVAEQSKNRPQTADDFKLLFLIPWDHHRRIIDKCKDDMDKALFFVRKTWEYQLSKLFPKDF